jgi:hypothetical protein
MDRHQLLIFDLKRIGMPAATATLARIAPFFDFDQRHLKLQARMRKQRAKVNQLVE